MWLILIIEAVNVTEEHLVNGFFSKCFQVYSKLCHFGAWQMPEKWPENDKVATVPESNGYI